jgi:hypothetical protein
MSQLKRKALRKGVTMWVLPAAGLRFGSVNYKHLKASFSWQLSGRIHQRINSSAQWHASSPAWGSSVAHFINAFSLGVSSRPFCLSLFSHWGALPKLTWNHLQKMPFQQPMKVTFRYSSRWLRSSISPMPEKTL